MSEIKVYYDANVYNKRDYVLNCTVSKDWDRYNTNDLKAAMREVGATAIIGGIKHAMVRDYLDIAFDIKENKLK